MHLLTTRTETAKLIALDKIWRGRKNYSKAMIEAEELVRALEVLGLIACMPVDTKEIDR